MGKVAKKAVKPEPAASPWAQPVQAADPPEMAGGLPAHGREAHY
jgi:hypothetical protein